MRTTRLNLAVLDVMLPDMDGFTLCQRIREDHLFPIIMLTAKVEDMDKIMGLTLGADDYITKPFNPLELVARVQGGDSPGGHRIRLSRPSDLQGHSQVRPVRRGTGPDALGILHSLVSM